MTKIDASFLQLQLEYSQWASELALNAARSLSDEELARDLGNSHGGVMGTLIHLFQSDRIWLSRLRGVPRLTLGDPEESWTLDSLAEAWAATSTGYQDWAQSVADADALLHYRNLAGKEGSLSLWQLIFHVVNHATYHRGQITTMLRQLGKPPVPTDLHTFYLNRR